MKSKQQLNRRLLGLVLLAVSAILLSGHSQSVNAQQWTGPDGNNNISNANTTGKVGIGTTSPQKQLHVTGSPESTIRLEDTLNPNTAEVTVTYDYIGIGANRENISGHIFNPNKAAAAFLCTPAPITPGLHFLPLQLTIQTRLSVCELTRTAMSASGRRVRAIHYSCH